MADNDGNVKLNPLAIAKAVVFLVAIVLAIALVSVIVKRASSPEVSNPETSNTSVGFGSSGDGTSSDNSTDAPRLDYEFVKIDNSMIYEGDLVLVNNEYGYSFPQVPIAEVVAETKTDDYWVRDRSVMLQPQAITSFNLMMAAFRAATGKRDIMIYNGYVSYETQESNYEAAVDKCGEEEASLYAPKPGGYDAHTGLLAELRVYNQSDKSYSTFDGTGDHSWIVNNAYRYGFVLRYPTGKELTTGVNGAANKYRYVGMPHSQLMYNNSLTLEEYHITVKNYRYDTAHWSCESDGIVYDVYYVPAGEGSTTDVPVPIGASYSLSGNNVDGFIVTVSGAAQ